MEKKARKKMINLISQYFDATELQGVYVAMGLGYDSLSSGGVQDRATKLVEYLARHDRLPELLRELKKERPQLAWPDSIEPRGQSTQCPDPPKFALVPTNRFIAGSGLVLFLILVTIFWPERDYTPSVEPTNVANLNIVTIETPKATNTLEPIPSKVPTNEPTKFMLAVEPIQTTTNTVTLRATPTPTPTPSQTPSLTATTNLNLPPLDASLGDRWMRPIDEMEMVFVPKGTFLMGSDSAVDFGAEDDEFPQRQIMVNSFWIDRTEVTNGQFVAFLNTLGNQQDEFDRSWLDIDDGNVLIEFNGTDFLPKVGFANHPVNNVSWYGADAYCKWVSGALPTEAQWEYAARGNDGRIYPWANEVPSCDLVQFVDCQGGTVVVGSFSPAGDSWVGAADMAGNVWEWVSDWYDPYYYGTGLTNNPIGATSGNTKVIRGGGWNTNQQGIRVAFRNNNFPSARHYSVGFRCILPAD